jgi:hypothetical protein
MVRLLLRRIQRIDFVKIVLLVAHHRDLGCFAGTRTIGETVLRCQLPGKA